MCHLLKFYYTYTIHLHYYMIYTSKSLVNVIIGANDSKRLCTEDI